MKEVKKEIKELYKKAINKVKFVEELREFIHRELSTINQPVDYVRWVNLADVEPNDYNPNSVAKVEMGLLYKSIKHDGYTQPIVTIWDDEKKKYIIVDGFHRYFTAYQNKDILNRNKGCVPIVVIEKDINERMAATVRHNRARGEHSVQGMSSMVFDMLQNGWSDEDVCNHLGMEAEEILKLKHITGFSKLFENVEYKQSWETKNMLRMKKDYKENNEKIT